MGAIAACAAFAAPAPAAPGLTEDWRSYANPRFRFVGCYPAALLKAQGEAPDGDGQRFAAADGAVAWLFGANEVLGRTQDGIMADDARQMLGPHGRASYSAVRPGMFVLSGTAGDRIAYEKTLLGGGQYRTLRLSYPARLRGIYDPVAARMARCFRAAEKAAGGRRVYEAGWGQPWGLWTRVVAGG